MPRQYAGQGSGGFGGGPGGLPHGQGAYQPHGYPQQGGYQQGGLQSVAQQLGAVVNQYGIPVRSALPAQPAVPLPHSTARYGHGANPPAVPAPRGTNASGVAVQQRPPVPSYVGGGAPSYGGGGAPRGGGGGFRGGGGGFQGGADGSDESIQSMARVAVEGCDIDYANVQKLPNWRKMFDAIVRHFADQDARKELDFPGTLQPQVRAHIHRMAGHYRLEHASHGKEGARVLKVWKLGHEVGAEHAAESLGQRAIDGFMGVQPLNDEFLAAKAGQLRQLVAPHAAAVREKLIAHLRQQHTLKSRHVSTTGWFTKPPPGGQGPSREDHAALLKFRHGLPGYKMRDEIVAAVKANPVTIVVGDTGCGKTTQLPQLLLDSGVGGKERVIICTQPRRVSAISVAARVAKERGEVCGDSVGYVIRFENVASVRTKIVYVTTGILLRRLHSDPSLRGVAAVVVDEVHERDVDTDFALLLLRDIVRQKRNPDLKLVVMSATIQIDKLVSYFSDKSLPRPPPMIRIPGSLFPVEEYYLDDAVKWLNIDPRTINAMKITPETARAGGAGLSPVSSGKPPTAPPAAGGDSPDHFASVQASAAASLAQKEEQQVPYNIVVGVIERYHQQNRNELGNAILVFLPGWGAIDKIMKLLQRSEFVRELSVLPLHSTLTTAEQQRVFTPPPKRFRKVVLSTNIAETSVTIDDVVLVIDSGLHKGTSYDARGNTSSLSSQLIARANGVQRRGRAGRCRAGVCVHLLPRAAYQVLPEFLPPEILRTPLEEVCLQAKAVMPDLRCATVLGKALDSPPVDSTVHAVSLLRDVGALDVQERLTPLGKVMATLPIHPVLSKMLLFSCVLGVFDPLCTVAAALGGKSPFMVPLPHQQLDARAALAKFDAGRQSDHLATVSLFQQWKSSSRQSDFAFHNFADHFVLRGIDRTREQLRRLILTSGFLNGVQRGWESRHAANEPLVRFALLSSLYPRVAVIERPKKRRPLTGYCWDGKAGQFRRGTALDGMKFDQLREREFIVYYDRMRIESALTLFDGTSVTRTAMLLAAKRLDSIPRAAISAEVAADAVAKYLPFDAVESPHCGTPSQVLIVDGGKKRFALNPQSAEVIVALHQALGFFFAASIRAVDVKVFPQTLVETLSIVLGQPAVPLLPGRDPSSFAGGVAPLVDISLSAGEAAVRPETDSDSDGAPVNAPEFDLCIDDGIQLSKREADMLVAGFGDLSWVASRCKELAEDEAHQPVIGGSKTPPAAQKIATATVAAAEPQRQEANAATLGSAVLSEMEPLQGRATLLASEQAPTQRFVDPAIVAAAGSQRTTPPAAAPTVDSSSDDGDEVVIGTGGLH